MTRELSPEQEQVIGRAIQAASSGPLTTLWVWALRPSSGVWKNGARRQTQQVRSHGFRNFTPGFTVTPPPPLCFPMRLSSANRSTAHAVSKRCSRFHSNLVREFGRLRSRISPGYLFACDHHGRRAVFRHSEGGRAARSGDFGRICRAIGREDFR